MEWNWWNLRIWSLKLQIIIIVVVAAMVVVVVVTDDSFHRWVISPATTVRVGIVVRVKCLLLLLRW